MRRVVVTGIGIVSSIGNNQNEVLSSLKAGTSGINYREDFEEVGLKSNVAGSIDLDLSEHIDRKLKRFMSDGIGFNYLAMQEAVQDSGLTEEEVSDFRTGLIMGNGGGSPETVVFGADSLREKGKVSPFLVTRSMASGNSGVLGTAFKIKGINYSISSACATSAHCIGNAAELIQFDKQDVVFAGAGDEVHWVLASFFDGMKALSASHNDNPHLASRPFDSDRDGFVISGGGGVIVLEEYEHALARDANIYGELTGYGATSDGFDMVQPSGEGAMRCMHQAMQNNGQIDYLNAHGTSTPVGDMRELEAVREVFGGNTPMITSTKSLTGHSLGVAGVHEAIYTILMLNHDFISPSINIDNLDEKAEGFNIITSLIENAGLETVMSNSFGFGGTNASLVFKKQ
ncbi:MAG TPA: beta-ketoacyl-ACP synthase I [Gammaproteobacteria bacterium]|nr:beta-ketoacyl-ACP synthase I [Gammaproteobacteria bacterium]